jgi:hypothetical protein
LPLVFAYIAFVWIQKGELHPTSAFADRVYQVGREGQLRPSGTVDGHGPVRHGRLAGERDAVQREPPAGDGSVVQRVAPYWSNYEVTRPALS